MRVMSGLINFCRLNRCSSRILGKISSPPLLHSNQYFPQVRHIKTFTVVHKYNNINRLPINEKTSSKKEFVTWKSVLIASTVGVALLIYMYYLQAIKDNEINRQRRRELGKAAIGGRFELSDPQGKTVRSEDFLGQWLLIYFGFTHCPDICPDELEKLSNVVNTLETEHNIKAQPIFISVDPDRDTPEVVGKYIKEFSDKILGLTGTKEQIANVCKAYRVYYSNGPKDEDSDYIVDHTIIIYLIDPEGIFVDYYGLSHTVEQVANSVVVNKIKYDNLKNDSWIPSIPIKNPLSA